MEKTKNKKYNIKLERFEKDLFNEIEKYCKKYGVCWAAGLAHKYNLPIETVVDTIKKYKRLLPNTFEIEEGHRKIYKITINEASE